MPKQKPICPACGSDEIKADAFAEWDIENQEWSLSSTYDDCYCENCERTGRPDWINVEENLYPTKSEMIKKAAETLGIPVIDIPLSHGDIDGTT